MFKSFFSPYFDSFSDAGGGSDKSDMDLLNVEKPEAKEEKEEKEEDLIEDEPEELEIIDEEDKEEKEDKEDKEDDLLPESNPRGIDFKKIKAKFPEFTKTHEYAELRNSYFRESKLSELFPTVEDATEAAENNESFLKLNNEILNEGSVNGLLNAIKEANPESLKKISSSFLDTLSKLDNNLYVEAITPVVKNLARNIYAQGKKLLSRDAENVDGKHLVATARNIMAWAFDDAELVDKADEKVVDNKDTKREEDLSNREKKIQQDRYVSAFETTASNLTRHLDKMIDEGLDPDNSLSEFTTEALRKGIKEEIEKQVTLDPSHMKRMQSLWKRAADSGYDRTSLSRILSAYLERVRPILPSVRNRLRSKALGKKENKLKNDDDIRLVKGGKSGRAPERDGKIKLSNVDSKKIDYRQTSDADLLSGKVKLRG